MEDKKERKSVLDFPAEKHAKEIASHHNPYYLAYLIKHLQKEQERLMEIYKTPRKEQ